METKSPWPLALKYGTILSLVTIILNLTFYFINPGAMKGETSALGYVQTVLTALVSVFILYKAAIERRDNELDGFMTYNKSLGFMVTIALPTALVISIYSFVFFKFIEPNMMGSVMEKQMEAMAEQGKSEEEIEMAMKYTKMFTSPAVLTLFGLFGSLFGTFIYSLIASIFTRKNPPKDEIQ